MSKPDGFELEGRINGLREVLQAILVQLSRQGVVDLRDALEERLVPSDQQEDPGAVPEPFHAVDAAATREIRLILEHVGARLQEAGDAAARNALPPQHDRR